MSTGVIFILGKGVSPILASGVKSTWPQGSSEPGFSNKMTRIHNINTCKVSTGHKSYSLCQMSIFINGICCIFIKLVYFV